MPIRIKNALHTIRERQGISAAKIADLVGVSRQTIYAIEACQYVPNTTIALRLANTLDTTVEELFWIEKGAPPRSERARETVKNVAMNRNAKQSR